MPSSDLFRVAPVGQPRENVAPVVCALWLWHLNVGILCSEQAFQGTCLFPLHGFPLDSGYFCRMKQAFRTALHS